MHKSKWNEYVFVECLGVLPVIDQDWEEWHYYNVRQNGLFFCLGLAVYKDLIWVSLSKDSNEKPFISFFMFVNGKINYINEKNVSYLRFEDCAVASNEYAKSKNLSDLNFEVHIFPNLELKFS